MQWTELIGVRTAAGRREQLEKKLKDFIGKVQIETSTQSIHLFRRVSVDSDLCVHLRHDSKEAAPTGSRLGLRLASELKAFGLVHHSIWIELPGNPLQPDPSPDR